MYIYRHPAAVKQVQLRHFNIPSAAGTQLDTSKSGWGGVQLAEITGFLFTLN